MPAVRIDGNGTAALSLALGLRRAGFEDVALAGSETHDPALDLSPNATRILAALGLGETLTGFAFEPALITQRAWHSGYLLTQRPLGSFARDRYGAPHLIVDEGALRDTLREQLHHLGVTERAPDLTHDTDTLLIGCHTQSSIRRAMGYDQDTATPSWISWRATVAGARAPRHLDPRAITSWIGPEQTFRHWPGADGRSLSLQALVPAAAGRDIAAAFSAWHPTVRRLIDAARDEHHAPLWEEPVLEQWYQHNLVLLGDACHRLHPYLQQGVALALEDAWVLARMLERWEEEVHHALHDYERFRRARVNRVRAETRWRWAEAIQSAGWRAQGRNLRDSLMNRFLPEMTMQQLDWLYGYDCIKGFD